MKFSKVASFAFLALSSQAALIQHDVIIENIKRDAVLAGSAENNIASPVFTKRESEVDSSEDVQLKRESVLLVLSVVSSINYQVLSKSLVILSKLALLREMILMMLSPLSLLNTHILFPSLKMPLVILLKQREMKQPVLALKFLAHSHLFSPKSLMVFQKFSILPILIPSALVFQFFLILLLLLRRLLVPS